MLPHTGQQIGLALVVQLAQHIVQQQHGMLAEQFTHHGRLGQLHRQHGAALLPLAAVDAGGRVVQQNFHILAVGTRQTKPRAQLGGAGVVQLLQQRVGGGGIGAHTVFQPQRFRPVGNFAVILCRHGGQRLQKLLAVFQDHGTVLGKLLVVGVQQNLAVRRYIVGFQQGVLL